MRLTELLSRAGMDFPEGEGYEDINITGITCDTRRLHEGNLFVALCGRHTDTHERIGEAVLRGAVNNSIDWDTVNTTLNTWREKSYNFLQEVLK